jgi:hypothetical protein
MLLISYSLKIVKLGIIILNIAYILGTFWIVICQFEEDFYFDKEIYDVYQPKPADITK